MQRTAGEGHPVASLRATAVICALQNREIIPITQKDCQKNQPDSARPGASLQFTFAVMPAQAPATVRAPRQLVLASTSPYRRELLGRLRVPFEVHAPGVAETLRDGEHPADRAQRLAQEKARAVVSPFPSALIIGSDQVAALGEAILDKPGSFANARDQLRRSSGNEVNFYTALSVLDARSGETSDRLVIYRVKFRSLTDAAIERYLHADAPFDCAGAAKCESLGITLIERMIGDDPTALIGLPLIALSEILRRHGFELP